MGFGDLPVGILQQIVRLPCSTPGVPPSATPHAVAGDTVATRLHAISFDTQIGNVRKKIPIGIAAAANARDHRIGVAACIFRHLHHALIADHALEVAHHIG